MKKKRKRAIYMIVIGFLGTLTLFLITTMYKFTDTQSIFLAIALFILGCLFALGMCILSNINKSGKK